MTAHEILSMLWSAGVRVRLKDDGHLAVPVGKLSPEHRAMVLNHRAELVEYLRAARQTAAHLIEAAMRACDHWGDSPQAREQMRQECAEVPPHQLDELLAHFRQAYPNKSGAKHDQ